MSSVRIPPVLRDAVDGARTLAATGGTVREVLDDLFARHPALRDRVTEEGELSRFVNVYVNDRDVRFRDGMGTPVGDGDTVILLPAMAGGAR
jgi:molybdopterin converting factor small subunit